MQYILMHKDIEVVTLEVDIETGNIQRVLEVLNIKHMPVGTYPANMVDRTALNEWIGDRSLPMNRSAVKDIIRHFHVQSPKALLFLGNGFSLSDCYWFKDATSDISWKSGNLFDNKVSDDVGSVLFGNERNLSRHSLHSSDVTTGGNLKKRWIIENDNNYLIKAGTGIIQQEVFNEAIASYIMDCLNIYHTPYTVKWINDSPYSCCKIFTLQSVELVSACYLTLSSKQRSSQSLYDHYKTVCNNLLGTNIVKELSQMLVIDYIIANEDRHLNNFGLLRNPDTLEWIGVAPIYDSGSSLGYNLRTSDIITNKAITSKPFRKDPLKQLQLVEDIDWLDTDQLQKCLYDLSAFFNSLNASDFMDTSRINAIISSINRRCTDLRALIKVRKAAGSNKMASELPSSQQIQLMKILISQDITDVDTWVKTHTAEEAQNLLKIGGDNR